MTPLNVSCALIIKDQKILAVQRGIDSDHPFEWEFPGGKIRPGETIFEAIIREIQEELSIIIEPRKELKSIQHDYGFRRIKLIPILCKMNSGEIYLNEHIAMKWLKMDDLLTLNWSEADLKLILKNKDILSDQIRKD